MADDVPGAGSGYRILQFTAPLSPGSSGGVLVDAEARILGIVVGSLKRRPECQFLPYLSTASPVSAMHLAACALTRARASATIRRQNDAYCNGSYQPSRSTRGSSWFYSTSSRTSAKFTPYRCSPKRFICAASGCKTIFIRRPCFPQLGVRFADYGRTADIAITVDRPVMTFDWTYTMVYQPKSLTLASGMVDATDEFDAGPKAGRQPSWNSSLLSCCCRAGNWTGQPVHLTANSTVLSRCRERCR